MSEKEEMPREVAEDQDQPSEEESDSGPDEEVHPIADAIDKYIHRIEDIEQSAKIFIPLSANIVVDSLKELQEGLNKIHELLRDEDPSLQMVGTRKLLKTVTNIDRLRESEITRVLERGLFLCLFSAFDAFTGDLLSAIYTRKPELFGSLDRSMAISEMLKYESLKDIRLIILQSEIESFRRDSYVDQFETLESRFGLKLRKFDRWPDFVECSQRRNLMTHCDGVVSDQYLEICRREGFTHEDQCKVGNRLKIGPEYFFMSCEVMCEVGAKLGHTLWRKVFPDELEAADRHLNDLVYDQNKRERWDMAMVLGKFVNSLPQKANEVEARIAVVNYAIALKFGGCEDEAIALLNERDWSAASVDFKLAQAVLKDDFEWAADLMERIGEESELVKEESYHIWPLFHKFRETQEFMDAYERVYGYPFIDKLETTAKEAEEKAEEEVEKQKKVLAEELGKVDADSPEAPIVDALNEEGEESNPSEKAA